jgi:hypothetical protein
MSVGVDILLQRAGLKMSDVTTIEGGLPNMPAMLSEKKGDLALATMPIPIHPPISRKIPTEAVGANLRRHATSATITDQYRRSLAKDEVPRLLRASSMRSSWREVEWESKF